MCRARTLLRVLGIEGSAVVQDCAEAAAHADHVARHGVGRQQLAVCNQHLQHKLRTDLATTGWKGKKKKEEREIEEREEEE